MFRPMLVSVTVPMITPMMTQQTPTEMAPLAPSTVASIILLPVMRVSFRSQLAAIVAKMAITAAYSGVYPANISPINTTSGITKCPCSRNTLPASGIFSLDKPDSPNRFASKCTDISSPR